MRVLIVFYSLSGVTREISKEIKKHFNDKYYEAGVRRIRNKTGLFELLINTILAKPVEIGHGKYHIDEYDIIFIGSPIWFGKPNAAINSFIDNIAHCKDKKFVCFTVGDVGATKTVKKMEEMIIKKKGKVVGTYSFIKSKIKKNASNEVEKFLKEINFDG